MELSEKEIQIIREEEASLLKLRMSYMVDIKENFRDEVLKEITDLNESIPEVNSDDLPQIKADLTRLDAILKQLDLIRTDTLDITNPYFGHMKLKDQHGFKDLYVGTHVYRSSDGLLQIVDWKTSPIALIYYLYEEGDDYEEDIEGRLFEGEVQFKRILKIFNGRLEEIQSGQLLLIRKADAEWKKVEIQSRLLKGGAGIASRPENTLTIDPKLGLDSHGHLQTSKLLPEITALIDPEQFDLITRPKTGVVAIQGLAGSGKTTVALHRVAWLHFQDKQRFSAENILVMVFNKALSNYIAKVLPSLGVKGVAIEYFDKWISQLRTRVFSGYLPHTYSELTPATVIRFKKHPILLDLMRLYISRKVESFDRSLASIIKEKKKRSFIISELSVQPLITKIFTLKDWIKEKRTINNAQFELDFEEKSKLKHLIEEYIDPERGRLETLIDFWEELFTDYPLLKDFFLEKTGDFSEKQLNEVFSWLKSQFFKLQSSDSKEEKELVELVSDDTHKHRPDSAVDYEDDAILVFLYQNLLRQITLKKRKKLEFNHLMVDEVQDFSPIELAVLTSVIKKPLSLTFAGDTNQKMIKHSGFTSWEQTFKTLDIKGQQVSPLKVGYRSTYEIMEFSLTVLGGLANSKEFIATRHGPPVELMQFSNQGQLLQYLGRNLIDVMTSEPMASIALICANREDANTYYELLHKLDVPELRLIDDQDFPFVPGIDVVDVRQVKGLEFDYVILLDVDKENYPDDSYSKYLLHIAASRAAHQLWIMNHHTPSEIIPKALLDRPLV